MTPVSARLIGFTICFLPLGAGTLLQTQHTRVGAAHDVVRNASVAAADCVRRVACDEASRFGGTPRGALRAERASVVRECATAFLDTVEGGDRAELSLTPPQVAEGDEVTVTVRLVFPCTVPFARAVACGESRELVLSHRERVVVTGCDQHD